MITAVIVTYNSENDIQPCLRGLFSQGMDVSCVVVDNASQDGTIEKLQEFGGHDLTVIRNEKNMGFAKAVNIAMQKVQGSRSKVQGGGKTMNDEQWRMRGELLKEFGGQDEGRGSRVESRGEQERIDHKGNNSGQDYILLLNPDAEMEEGALARILETMRSHPQAAIVQPLITLMRKPDRVNTSGNRYRGFGLVTIGDFGEEADSFFEDRQIEYASGACMLIKAEVFEELGGLDEKFFLYFEDTDFSQRVRKAGYEIWLSAQARVRHDHFFPFRMAKVWNFVRSWGKFLKGA